MRLDIETIIKVVLFFLVIYAVNVAFVWFVTSDYFSSILPTSDLPSPILGEPLEKPAPVLTAIVNSIKGILGALTWFVPGYYAGRDLKQMGLMHGAIIGVIGFCVAFIILSAFPELGFEDNRNFFGVLYNAAGIAFLCSLAGGVGELHSEKGIKV